MTSIAEIPAVAQAEIQSRIRRIAQEEGVRILFAVESGSRAWGFPSTDSDYDVRFVYAHPRDWYLSLQPGRDVIERPIVDDFDVSGWDIRKALNLMLKSNPVLLEWLTSPIRYQWDADTSDALAELASRATRHTPSLHHYWKLGRRQWDADAPQMKIKRYLYTLRAALALRWLEQNAGSPPPMNVFDLLGGVEIGSEAEIHLKELISRKADGMERGLVDKEPVLDALVHEAFEWAEANRNSVRDTEPLKDEATALFRRIIAP